MQIGLAGLPQTGKTTFFNLLTGADIDVGSLAPGSMDIHLGSAVVPDSRIDFLSKLYEPRKTIYAQIQFKDIPGVQGGEDTKFGVTGKFLDEVRGSEALVHLVRAFENEDVPHLAGKVDPYRDLNDFHTELLLADMGLIEKRIDRINSSKKITKEAAVELEVLKKYLVALGEEEPVSNVEINDNEKECMASYSFLTEKPIIIAVNLDEAQMTAGDYPGKEKIQQYADEHGLPVVEVCAQIEMEINGLPREDRVEFMADYGLQESGISRLARAAYDLLGLISFFTVGDDEVRAWTIQKGTVARKAAGKVHSDIERGFIRAEVFKYRDLHELGTPAAVRENGLFRLEGKEYLVEDGDIINFRFNV
ncbi:MAG TPA: redox-regulated ATPase YchF [Clostridia bacterium]|nr:redox-regulated ATPase YchF [Clostridia bacterium]